MARIGGPGGFLGPSRGVGCAHKKFRTPTSGKLLDRGLELKQRKAYPTKKRPLGESKQRKGYPTEKRPLGKSEQKEELPD